MLKHDPRCTINHYTGPRMRGVGGGAGVWRGDIQAVNFVTRVVVVVGGGTRTMATVHARPNLATYNMLPLTCLFLFKISISYIKDRTSQQCKYSKFGK